MFFVNCSAGKWVSFSEDYRKPTHSIQTQGKEARHSHAFRKVGRPLCAFDSATVVVAACSFKTCCFKLCLICVARMPNSVLHLWNLLEKSASGNHIYILILCNEYSAVFNFYYVSKYTLGISSLCIYFRWIESFEELIWGELL